MVEYDSKKIEYPLHIDEMIANAWYSVLEFHVHLSGIWGDGEVKDSLEKAVVKLHTLSGLPANASKVEIKNKIKEYEKGLQRKLVFHEAINPSGRSDQHTITPPNFVQFCHKPTPVPEIFVATTDCLFLVNVV